MRRPTSPSLMRRPTSPSLLSGSFEQHVTRRSYFSDASPGSMGGFESSEHRCQVRQLRLRWQPVGRLGSRRRSREPVGEVGAGEHVDPGDQDPIRQVAIRRVDRPTGGSAASSGEQQNECLLGGRGNTARGIEQASMAMELAGRLSNPEFLRRIRNLLRADGQNAQGTPG